MKKRISAPWTTLSAPTFWICTSHIWTGSAGIGMKRWKFWSSRREPQKFLLTILLMWSVPARALSSTRTSCTVSTPWMRKTALSIRLSFTRIICSGTKEAIYRHNICCRCRIISSLRCSCWTERIPGTNVCFRP